MNRASTTIETSPVGGAGEAGAAADEAAIYSKITWRLIPFLLIAYVLCYIDRSNVSFAYLRFKSDVGLSDAAYGLGAGIFYLGYIIFEVPSNMLLERLGARKTILRIMVLWGLVSSATAFVASPMQFYVVRILLGVAEAGFFPGLYLVAAIQILSGLAVIAGFRAELGGARDGARAS